MTLDEFGRPLSDAYTADGTAYTIQHERYTLLGQRLSSDGNLFRGNRLIGRDYRITENGLGLGLDNIYDSDGRWVASYDVQNEQVATYDANGRIATYQPGNGQDTYVVNRDANGRPLRIVENGNAGETREVDFSWYGNGLLETSTVHGVTTTYIDDPQTGNVTNTSDTIGRTAAFTYDAAGNVVSADDDATTWTFNHDPNNRLIAATDQENNTTTLSYVQRSCGCSEANLLTSLQTPDLAAGLAWQFGYAAEGRLSTVTDPDGNSETYSYQPSGELTQLVDRNGHPTTMGYDHLGRVTSTVDAIGRAHARAYAAPIAGAWSGQDVLSGSASSTAASTNFAQSLNNGDYQIGTNAYDTFTGGIISSGPITRGWANVEFYRDATFQLSYGSSRDNFGRVTNTEDRPSSQLTSSSPFPSGSGAIHSDPLIYGLISNDSALPVPAVTTRGQGTANIDSFAYSNEYDMTGSNGDGAGAGTVAQTTFTRDVAGRITNISTGYIGGIPFGQASNGHPFLTVNQSISYVPSGVNAGRVATDPQGAYTYDNRGLVKTRAVPAGTYTYGYDSLGRNNLLTYPTAIHARRHMTTKVVLSHAATLTAEAFVTATKQSTITSATPCIPTLQSPPPANSAQIL